MLDHESLLGSFISFQLSLRLGWQRSISRITEFELECLSYTATIPRNQTVALALTSRLLEL